MTPVNLSIYRSTRTTRLHAEIANTADDAVMGLHATAALLAQAGQPDAADEWRSLFERARDARRGLYGGRPAA